jgi:hypothetical protein
MFLANQPVLLLDLHLLVLRLVQGTLELNNLGLPVSL